VNIYLHASYTTNIDIDNNSVSEKYYKLSEFKGIDIDMWLVATRKQKEIQDKIDTVKIENIKKYSKPLSRPHSTSSSLTKVHSYTYEYKGPGPNMYQDSSAHVSDKYDNENLEYTITYETFLDTSPEALALRTFQSTVANITYTRIPTVDNRFVFSTDHQWVWDLRDCFEHNKYKISWCIVNVERARGYNILTKECRMGQPPPNVVIHTSSEKEGYVIWRSVVDLQLRISCTQSYDPDPHTRYNTGTKSRVKRKYKNNRRGKLLSNVNHEDVEAISSALNCNANIKDIIKHVKANNAYFDNQVELVDVNNDLR
jgi:hypothetical protein